MEHTRKTTAIGDPDLKPEVLVPWSQDQFQAFGFRPLVAAHRLNELTLFQEENLITVLDRYPRELLQVFTMGTDPSHPEDWQLVDSSGLSGEELYHTLSLGRLWFNLRHIESVDHRYRQLIDGLYGVLNKRCPHFHSLKTSGTLIISSPDAMVYYHIDAPANILWHIEGKKRVWIYPAYDHRFAPQDLVEDVFADAIDENLPYVREFDESAQVFDPKPGEVLSWPQAAPHRVENLGTINISLATYYVTEETEHRRLVYVANRFFRNICGLPMRSAKFTGIMATAKTLGYRLCHRAGFVRSGTGPNYKVSLHLDPTSPQGISSLAGVR